MMYIFHIESKVCWNHTQTETETERDLLVTEVFVQRLVIYK